MFTLSNAMYMILIYVLKKIKGLRGAFLYCCVVYTSLNFSNFVRKCIKALNQ